MASSPEAVYCIRHPQRETGLRCARCNDPICTQCMVQAAVGNLCPACVSFERNPLAQVQTPRMLTAVAAGLGAALVAGIVVSILSSALAGYFSIIIWAAAGYLLGQVVHLASNRSRAPALRYVAGGCAFFAWGIALLGSGGIVLGPILIFRIVALVIAIVLAISPFRQL